MVVNFDIRVSDWSIFALNYSFAVNFNYVFIQPAPDISFIIHFRYYISWMLLRNVVFTFKKALAVAACLLHMTLVETAKAKELYELRGILAAGACVLQLGMKSNP